MELMDEIRRQIGVIFPCDWYFFDNNETLFL
jgi:hypothetical protein